MNELDKLMAKHKELIAVIESNDNLINELLQENKTLKEKVISG